jgi:hypothetical protein
MEAQDYVSKIVRREKVHRAMVTELKVVKYRNPASFERRLLTGSSLYCPSGQAIPAANACSGLFGGFA